MRKLLIGLVAVVVIAGGAYYGLAILPTQLFQSGIDSALHRLPPGETGSYQEASYSFFSHQAVLKGVAFHRADPNGFDFAADELFVTNPSTDFGDAWTRDAANPADIPQDQVLQFADSVVARNASFRNSQMSVAIASFSIARPRVYPWALLHPGVPTMAEAQTSLMHRDRPPQPSDYLPFAKLEAALMLGIAYDGYRADEMVTKIEVPPAPNFPGGSATYAVQSTESGPFDRGIIAGGSIDGTTVRVDNFGVLSVGHVAVEGFTAQQAMMKILTSDMLDASMLDGISLKRISYGPITLEATGQAQEALGTVTVANLSVSGGRLASVDLAYDGVHLTRERIPNPVVADAFDKLGIDAITLGVHIGYRWDAAAQHLSLHDTSLDIPELGSLTLSADVDRASTLQTLLAGSRLTHAALRYKDASLVQRVLAMVAEERGTDVQSLREAMIDQTNQTVADPSADPATVAAAKAFAAFIANPKSLEITIAPPNPIPPSALLGVGALPPPVLVPRLGLTVSANQ